MTKILHFVTDYPESLSATTTLAVKNLLESTSSTLTHHIVMVDREKHFFCRQLDNGSYHLGFPRFKFGLFNTTISFLMFLVFIKRFDIWKSVDVVHCHKLTIDGVFGLFCNLLLGLPYVISVRGASDEKWLRKKFYAKWIFKMIIQRSAHIFFVSAFMKNVIHEIFGHLSYRSSQLANISGCEFVPLQNEFSYSNKLLFIGRLTIWRLKGLDNVIKAIADKPNLSLDIIGGGIDTIEEIKHFAAQLGCQAQLNFIGTLPNQEVKNRLSQYVCLVMPSYPETFGMAYVEALNANVPVLGSKRAGITGYVDGKPYIQCIDERDVMQIGTTIERLYREQILIKEMLRNDFPILSNLFSDVSISNHYTNTMQAFGRAV